MPNIAQVVMPDGTTLAPASLAPLLPEPLTGMPMLSYVSDGGTPPHYVCVWVYAAAGGEPVTTTGYGNDYGNDYGGPA